MKHPELFAYTGNQRHNARAFTDAHGNTYYFSYKTLVAFQTNDGPLVVHENVWSNTTGRHLAQIDGGDKSAKKSRLKSAEFEAAYKLAFGPADAPVSEELEHARKALAAIALTEANANSEADVMGTALDAATERAAGHFIGHGVNVCKYLPADAGEVARDMAAHLAKAAGY